MIHYVYRLTYLGETSPKYYIGKHSGNIGDLGTKYFTSSKIVRKIFKKDPKSFKTKIIRVFDTCTQALAFESKILRRVDACRNKLFFNQSNYSYYTKDRTSLVTVFDNILHCKRSISCDEYYANKDRYISDHKGLTIFKDSDGNIIRCSNSFASEHNLVGVNKGVVFALNGSGEYVRLTQDEYLRNKDKFKVNTTGNVVCKDTVTGETKRVSKEEFDSNPNLKGVYDKYQFKICPLCNKQISVQNYDRHINRHKARILWVTDGKDTWKCTEEKYLLKYKDKFNIIQKNKDNTIGYIDGKPYNIRFVGRIRKNFYLE